MTDTITERPLQVSDGGVTGHYITVPVSQLDILACLLAQHRIAFDVDEHAISLDGGPEVTDVNLGRGSDPAAVQWVLDNAR